MSPRHFLNTQDWTRPELDALLESAAAFKRERIGRDLAGKSIALLFFNASMRTRTSSAAMRSCSRPARTPGRSSSPTAR
jgi:N-acetylornithine carbamoyltransferase